MRAVCQALFFDPVTLQRSVLGGRELYRYPLTLRSFSVTRTFLLSSPRSHTSRFWPSLTRRLQAAIANVMSGLLRFPTAALGVFLGVVFLSKPLPPSALSLCISLSPS